MLFGWYKLVVGIREQKYVLCLPFPQHPAIHPRMCANNIL
jgi:hypothetical protein